MGLLKDFGLATFDELESLFQRTWSVQRAINVLVESYCVEDENGVLQPGPTLKDMAFSVKEFRDQVTAVANHPEYWGHEEDYWKNLREKLVRSAKGE